MGLKIFQKIFGRKEEVEERRPPREPLYYDDHEGKKEMEDESLLVDHHFIYPPDDDYEKHISSIAYKVDIENTTDYPMGNVRLEFKKGSKLGSFGKTDEEGQLLDPGDRTSFVIPYKPNYMGGKDRFDFDIVFFDFKHKVEETIRMRTEPLKVVVPKFQKLEMDEDGYRLLTGDLYRWPTESDIMEVPPEELYELFTSRFSSIGFSKTDEMVNKALFRGIRKLVATDRKGRKWAAQVQVIGQGKESKFLLYTFGEKPQYAYNLAVKTLLKIERRQEIMEAVL